MTEEVAEYDAKTTTPAIAARPELLTINPEQYATALYLPFRARLDKARSEVATINYDIKTTAGMKVAVAARARFRDLRLEAEKARKERKAPVIELGKLLDGRYKELEAEIAPLEERFDTDIKAEEKRKAEIRAAEQAKECERIEAIQAKIGAFGKAADALVGAPSDSIHAAHQQLEAREITLEEFAEFAGQAMQAKNDTLDRLSELFKKAVDAEAEVARVRAERAELARLREQQAAADAKAKAEREEQDRKNAEARAAQEAKDKAARDAEQARLDAQRREQEERQAELDRKEREHKEREERIAREAHEAEQHKIREADQRKRDEEQRIEDARKMQEGIERAAREKAEREARDKAEAEQREKDAIAAARRPHDDAMIEVLRAGFSTEVFKKEPPTALEIIAWIATFDVADARLRHAP